MFEWTAVSAIAAVCALMGAGGGYFFTRGARETTANLRADAAQSLAQACLAKMELLSARFSDHEIMNAENFAALRTKVDTMWQFQMRRAMSEVVNSGLGTINSPLTFSKIAYDSLEPIKHELIQFYSTMNGADDASVLLEIERVFGHRLLHVVCIPCGLSHGACLLLALAVAKQAEGSIDIAV